MSHHHHHHHRRDSSGDVVHVIPTNNPPLENWFPNLGDNSAWATEDDYNRVYPEHGENGPPNKKSRGSPSSLSSATVSSNRTKAIGKMFFKTKLCCKFRAGTCPYVTNCNFAHTVEELRRPPANWQEIVAAHEEERTTPEEPREEFQIPSLVSNSVESGRSFKGRHCKKFYTVFLASQRILSSISCDQYETLKKLSKEEEESSAAATVTETDLILVGEARDSFLCPCCNNPSLARFGVVDSW